MMKSFSLHILRKQPSEMCKVPFLNFLLCINMQEEWFCNLPCHQVGKLNSTEVSKFAAAPGSASSSVTAADGLKETKINEWPNTREEPDVGKPCTFFFLWEFLTHQLPFLLNRDEIAKILVDFYEEGKKKNAGSKPAQIKGVLFRHDQSTCLWQAQCNLWIIWLLIGCLNYHPDDITAFPWKECVEVSLGSYTRRGEKNLISCGMKPEVKSKWGTSLGGAGLLYVKNANSLVGKNDFSAL